MVSSILVDPRTTAPQKVSPRPDPDLASAVGKHLRDESNVVMGVGGYYKNVLRFQPPLSIMREQLEFAVDELEDALETVA